MSVTNRAKHTFTALMCVLLVTACQTTRPVENPRQVWCETNKPLPKLSDIALATLSRSEKEKLVSYQLKGEDWCGWLK